ncbi:MAG: annexin [Bacteroidetes bacterium]|nr:annexin [Bacteroidota bacterium]
MNQLQSYQPATAPDTFAPPAQEAARPSFATTLKDDSWTLKEKIVYGLLAAVGVGGTIWIGRKIVLDAISSKEELKSFDEGTPATTAKQIKMAFENDGWWGTNTDSLREALIAVPSQEEWDKIVKSYQKQYNSNLIHDMADELQTTEYNEMMQIVNAKPLKKGQAPQSSQYRAWAKRLKAAFDKEYGFLPGTDSVAVDVTIKEIPTQAAFIKVGVEYKTLYGTNLLDDLRSESEFGQYDEWLQIIVKKKKS